MINNKTEYKTEIDFELDCYSIEAVVVEKLPDPSCVSSDWDYYGYTEIDSYEVFREGVIICDDLIPKETKELIEDRIIEEYNNYKRNADILNCMEVEFYDEDGYNPFGGR